MKNMGTPRIRRSRESGKERADLLALVDECASLAQPDEETLRSWAQAYLRDHRLRLARDLEILEMHVPPGSKLAEFGAVPLLLTFPLQRLGYDVTGIDIDPSRFGNAIDNGNLQVMKCDIERENLPAGDSLFDAVLFNELFEHLRIDLIHTMNEVRRVLKPGGLLLLSSPNLRSLEGLLNFVLRNRAASCSGDVYAEYEKLRTLGHMGHVREYTTTELIEFLERVGFKVEQLIFRGDFGRGWKSRAARLVPGLRPFVTYIARAT